MIPWAAIGTAASGIGSMLGGISSLMGGGSDANKDARRMYTWQRQFQLDDIIKQDSRKVQSLELAGLNPALAYGGFGGPSTPIPSASPQFPPDYENNRVNSAREGLVAMAQIAKLKADTDASESVADLNRATAIRTGVQTQIDSANAGLSAIELQRQQYLRDIGQKFFVEGRELDARLAHSIYDQLKASNDTNSIWLLNRIANEHGFTNYDQAVGSVNFRRQFQDMVLQQYSMPKASAEHDFYLSTFGKSIAPYLNSAESISRTVRPFSR